MVRKTFLHTHSLDPDELTKLIIILCVYCVAGTCEGVPAGLFLVHPNQRWEAELGHLARGMAM